MFFLTPITRNLLYNSELSPNIDLPFTTSLRPDRGPKTFTFTRATTATVTDYENLIKLVRAGEARFCARRVENLITGASENFTHSSWVKSLATATPTTITFPNDGNALVSQNGRFVAGHTYRLSFEASQGTTSTFYVKFYDGVAEQLSTLITLDGTSRRYSVIATVPNTYSGNNAVQFRYASTGSVNITRVILEDVTGQTNQNPSEYVPVGGLRRNLIVRSQEYSHASWNKTDTTVTANNLLAPNGALSADLLTEGSAGNAGVSQNTTVIASSNYSWSIYLKRGNHDWVRVVANQTSGGSNQFRVWVNLATGTLGTGNAIGTATYATATIQALPNGWYRISVTGTFPATDGTVSVTSATADGSTTRVSGGTRYQWGSQLELGSSATEYQKVTDASAGDFDYYYGAGIDGVRYFDSYNGNTVTNLIVTEGYGGPIPLAALKGYTTEGPRTNLLPRSAAFNDAAWIVTALMPFGLGSTANAAIAPDGTMTADHLVPDLTLDNNHQVGQNLALTSGSTYTLSVYAKAGGYGYIMLSMSSGSGAFAANQIAVFNLTTGSCTGVGGTPTYRAYYLRDGWWRFEITATATGTATSQFALRVADAYSNTAFIGDGVSGVYFWGAQAEVGKFASSYIPTEGASVIRNGDILSYPIAELVTNTSGSCYVELVPLGNDISNSRIIGSSIGDAPMTLSTPNVSVAIYDGATNTVVNGTSLSVGTLWKAATRWGQGSKRCFLAGNSSPIGTYDGTLLGAGSTLWIGGQNGGAGGVYFYGTLRNLRIWRRMNSDTTLARQTA
jgi:hypothetical protein